MSRIINIIGGKFDRLLVIEYVGNNKHGAAMFLCVCDCGNSKTTLGTYLRSGESKSCGCLNKEKIGQVGKSRITHGLSSHPLYGILKGIRERCYDKNNPAYKLYGEIGVRICKEWLDDVKSFYNWAIANGWKKGLQIDKDIIPLKLGVPAKLYCPEYCSIVTPQENSNARKTSTYVTFNGATKTPFEWSKITGIPQAAISQRVTDGFEGEEAIYGVRLLKRPRRIKNAK